MAAGAIALPAGMLNHIPVLEVGEYESFSCLPIRHGVHSSTQTSIPSDLSLRQASHLGGRPAVKNSSFRLSGPPDKLIQGGPLV
jgi:hypothetical protein